MAIQNDRPVGDPLAQLKTANDRRILLLVMDGLGGLPRAPGGPTELEAARTPNLDALAAGAECGLHVPVDYGIAPGSAPGHLALFGYDPLRYPIGRGIVAALGIGYPIHGGDVAARLNFATPRPFGRGDRPPCRTHPHRAVHAAGGAAG